MKIDERVTVPLSAGSFAGGLALLLLALSENERLAIELFDWAVIAIFVYEYATGLRFSSSKAAYIRSAANLLTLSIFLLAFLGLFVSSPILFSAPALRLLRSARVVTEATRSASEIGPEAAKTL